MTKRVMAVVLVLALAALFGLVAGCGGDLPNDAVAKVGDSYITEDQFDARIASFEAQYAGMVPDKDDDPEGYKAFQVDVLDYMVTYELAAQKASSLDVSVSDEEVQTEIDAILTDSFGGDQAAFDEALAAQNMTLDELKQNYKESMLLQAVYEEVTKDVTTAPEADISAYYEENKANYYDEETRTARHILISPIQDTTDDSSASSDTSTTVAEPTDDDWTTALATAEEVRTELVGGADWMKIAAEYSDDTGTKDLGGDLGMISKGEMVPEFEESVFSLALDEISQPIKTTYGYHIIQVTGITPAKQYTLDEVRDEITSNLVNDAKGEAWLDWIAKTKTELGVIYRPGLEPATTTTTVVAPDTTSTSAGAETTTTAAGQDITTATTASSETTTTE